MTQIVDQTDVGDVPSGERFADQAAGIVLIHALGRSRWSMSLMARRLRAMGWPVAVAAYPSRRLSIEASADLVANQIAEASRGWGSVSYTHLTLPTTPYV